MASYHSEKRDRSGLRLLIIVALIVGVATWVGGNNVAGAAVKEGTSSGDVLRGTMSHDRLFGKGADDTLTGKAGNDYLVGGAGADTIECDRGYDSVEGNGGPDMILCSADDGRGDVVDCGRGEDIVFVRAGNGNVVFNNCEHVFEVNGSPN